MKSPRAWTLVLLVTLTIAPITSAQDCSDFFVMQVVGGFNDWNADSPFMSTIQACAWADTLSIPSGCHLMKFRTNFDWDATPDFGRCGGEETICELAVPPDGSPLQHGTCLVTGLGTALGELEFTELGIYEFVLEITSTAPTPAFRIRRLPGGGIRATVAYADEPPLPPLATASVFLAGTSDLVATAASSPFDGVFEVAGLAEDLYDVLIEAPGYASATIEGVSVDAPLFIDLGTITLDRVCEHSMVQVVGEFNDWNPNADPMDFMGACSWVDTLLVPVGCHLMKFRTENSWDVPPDYGRCAGEEGICQVPVPLDGGPLTDITCLVTGFGTALGEIEFPADGFYEFLLDEIEGTYSIRLLGGAVSLQRQTWSRIKARYRSAGEERYSERE